MFQHKHANTINLVERCWQYIKYIFLDGIVNCGLDNLSLALINYFERSLRFGGGTLVDHYDRIHWLSEFEKYV